MMKRVFLLAGLAALATSAFGNNRVYYSGPGLGTSGKVSGTYIGGGINPGYSWSGVFAGQLIVDFDMGGDGSYEATGIKTFCITPQSPILSGNPSNPFELDSGSPYIYTGNNPTTYGGALDEAWAKIAWLVDTKWSSIVDDNTAASFQLALWAIVSNPFSSSNGLGGAIWTQANTWVTEANAAYGSGDTVGKKMTVFDPLDFPDQNGDGGQILVTYAGGGNGGYTPVPEPFTMGLGLAAAGAFIRRRVKAKKAA